MGSEARQGAGRGTVVMVTKDRQIDRRILQEADTLEAAGWRIGIIAMPEDEPAGPADPRVVRLPAGAPPQARRENVLLALYRLARSRLPMEGRWMRLLKSFAWRHVVPPDRFFRTLFDPVVAAHPADVYLAHDLPLLPVALEAARRNGGKVVYDSHELYAEQDFSEAEKRLWRRLEAGTIGRCDAVITVNGSIARELQQRYGLAHVHVVQNAERARPDAPRSRRFHERLALPQDALVLLLQGGLSAGRHIEQLVEAMAQVRHPGVHLVVLGDGKLRDVLGGIVDRLGLAARVHLLPAVAQQELLGWTEAADAGVIPYQATCLNNYYCTPNKLFEFIAAGLPVLASDLPEIRGIVEGHGIGQVAPMGDAAQMAQAIDAFFGDPGRLRAWREAARRARTTLNWDEEGAKLVEVFEALR